MFKISKHSNSEAVRVPMIETEIILHVFARQFHK